MPKLTGADFAEKWARRLSGATEDIRKGVETVAESPGAKAAAKKNKWVARMTDAATHDKWAKNISAVTVDEWRQKTLQVGLGRISAGVTAAQNKMAKFGEQLIAYQNANLPRIQSMPDLTLGDSKARMDAWFDIMSKFKPSK